MQDKIEKIQLKELELIFLHVPKTGGTSIHKLLEEQYGGEKNVSRLIIRENSKISPYTTHNFNKEKLESSKVVHGHFMMEEFNKLFDYDRRVPIVTWLRDPVDRVVSNYYYLSDRLDEELANAGVLIKFKQIRRTLAEYVRSKAGSNRMSRILKGMDPSDFAFIGFLESMDKDINALIKLMGWSVSTSRHLNKTVNKVQEIDKETLDIIRAENKEDIEYYNAAMEFCAKLGNN